MSKIENKIERIQRDFYDYERKHNKDILDLFTKINLVCICESDIKSSRDKIIDIEGRLKAQEELMKKLMDYLLNNQ